MPDSKDATLSALVDAAFRRAADDVVRRAKETGTPVIVWQDGQIRAVPPDEIRLPESNAPAAEMRKPSE